MRKIIVTLLLTISAILSATLTYNISTDIIDIEGNFLIEVKEKIIDKNKFVQIETDCNAVTGNYNDAALPASTKLLALPAYGNYQIEKIEYDYEEQKLQSKVLPHCYEDNISKINNKYYETDTWFPKQIVKLNKPVIMRNNRFSQIRISAVQYNPAKNKLRIIKNLKLKLKLERDKNGNVLETRQKLASESFTKIAQSNILNYNRNSENENSRGSYLFIIPNNSQVEDKINTLANWKNKLGYECYIASLDLTGYSTEQIKQYIQNAYDNWQNPPEYVILCGDVTGNYTVPAYYVDGYLYPYAVSDHNYTLLAGNDYFPDIKIGRISYQNLNSLSTVVNKIIAYESNPYTDFNWFQKALMCTVIYNSYTSARETKMLVRDKLFDYNYAVVDTFFSPYQIGMNNLTNMINSGYSMINYRGFGSYDYWSSISGYMLTTDLVLNNLNNGYLMPMVTSIVCGGGDFAADEASTCFGEAWLIAGSPSIPQGAIGFIGPSERDTKTPFNNAIDLGLYQGIANENLHKCGEMLLRGKMELYMNYPDGHAWGDATNSDQFYFYVYNLLGDPGLTVWTDIPKAIELDFTEEISSDANYLQCQVATEYDNENFCIALTDEEGLITTAYTNENGLANLEIALEPGEYKVTASKQGYIPETKDLQVTTENSMALTNINFSDEIIAGSELDLTLTIQNNTNNIAENIDLELIANDDYIDVPAPQSQINEILSGENETITFALDLDNYWLDNNDTELFLQVNSNLGEQQFMIPISIKSPELTIADFNFDNNNNILLPDGTTDFTISLENIGSANSGNFTAFLSTAEENVEIIQSNTNYPDIESEENEVGGFFTMELNNRISGDVIRCNLQIQQQGNIAQDVNFQIPIGEVEQSSPSFSGYGYIGIESNDSGNFEVPNYDWIEIDPASGGDGTYLSIDNSTTDGYVGIIDLPFNFEYFGNFYNQISICSNGWAAFGNQPVTCFRNRTIPSGTGPSAMLAPFWDNLYNGDVSTYYDENEHIFIIEWNEYRQYGYYYDNSFQIILYDQQYHSDQEFKFQYKDIWNVDMQEHYATVGIENHNQDDGILFTYADNYSQSAHEISSETAISFKLLNEAASSFLQTNTESFSYSLIPDTSFTFPLTLTNIGNYNIAYEIELNHARDGSGIRNVEEDIILRANNFFEPNSHWTANCYLLHNDIDGEGIYGIKLDFPDGCEVNTASNIGSLEYNGETGNGSEISWGFGNGEIEYSTTPIYFSVGLFINSEIIEPITVEWYIEGDGSGSEPHFVEDEIVYEPAQSNYIYLDYPAGGEEIVFDIEETIAWHYYGEIEAVDIFIKAADIHNDWQVIAENISNDLSYEFTPPAPLSEHYKIKIADVNGSDADISDEFTITALDFIYPAQGTAIQYGEERTIEWENLSTIAEVDLQITTDNGDNWQVIADNITNDGDFIYDFTSEPSDNCELMISASNNPEVVNYSGKFTISESPVEWLSTENLSGEIAGNQSEEIIFEIDTNGLEEDSYYANIQITSDIGQVINIPVNLNVTTNTNENSISPSSLSLNNYPNPFNPTTIISFKLASAAKENAKIEIYNLKGQKVKTLLNRKLAAGNHRVVWNGDDDNGKPVGSGVYFYKLKIDDILKSVKKCLLVK